jgi:L-ascorbate metabolism protein UlaG (beta-lactamase superfamily)
LVRGLLEQTLDESAPLIGLARDYAAFDRALQSSAQGYALDALYENMPQSLRGLAELRYDLNNHACVRLHEGLLDEVFNAHLEEVYVGPLPNAGRKFFLSNPCLHADGVRARVKFRSAGMRDLLAACEAGVAYDTLRQVLGAPAASALDPLLRPARAEEQKPAPASDGLRIRYFGHACILIETRAVSIMIDPVVAWGPSGDGTPCFSFDDLPPRIDYVVLTHAHHDHFSPETLLRLRHRIGKVVAPVGNGGVADPSLRLMLARLGFDDVVSLMELQAERQSWGAITALPLLGEHADLDISSKQAVMVEIADRRLVFLADTNAVDGVLYERLAPRIGAIDALFVGMECHGAPLSWLYGPLLSTPLSRKNDDSRRLSASDSTRAMRVVAALRPAQVFIYAMGQEPWLSHLTGLAYSHDSVQLVEVGKFLAQCADCSVPARTLTGSQELELS